MVIIWMGFVFRNEYMYMYKDIKKICKEFEEVILLVIFILKFFFLDVYFI